MRRAARIDENQPAIVAALREFGATVQPLHAVGGGCPDILCGYKGKNYLFEIKNPAKPKRDQDLTEDQIDWVMKWKGHHMVIKSANEAIWTMTR